MVKRGSILLEFNQDYPSCSYYQDKQNRGGARIYTPKMYEFLLTLKVMFRLPWRYVTGHVNSLLEKAFPGQKISIPDYAHASREAAKLDLKINMRHPAGDQGLVLAFDSTSINVYTTSGWHERKYGKDSLCKEKDQWKKVHLALDLGSQSSYSS